MNSTAIAPWYAKYAAIGSGAVEAIKVPLEGNADASVYVRWSRPAEAAAARQSFSGRKFDGRTVEVSLVPEADFEALNDG